MWCGEIDARRTLARAAASDRPFAAGARDRRATTFCFVRSPGLARALPGGAGGMAPLVVAAGAWPSAPPRHVVVASVAAPLGADATTLWTGADDGGVVRWVARRDDDRRAFLHPSATAFLSGHTRRVNALAHVPSAGDDSNPASPASPGVVMSAGEDGVACAWRVDTGACVARRALGEDGCAIRSLALLRRRPVDSSSPRDPSSPRASAATPPAVVAASCVFADGRAALALIDPATLAVVAAVDVSPRGDGRTSDASEGPSRRTSDSASASVVDAALAVVPIARDANDPANARWPWDGDLAAVGADGVPRRLPRPKPGASLAAAAAARSSEGRRSRPNSPRGGGGARRRDRPGRARPRTRNPPRGGWGGERPGRGMRRRRRRRRRRMRLGMMRPFSRRTGPRDPRSLEGTRLGKTLLGRLSSELPRIGWRSPPTGPRARRFARTGSGSTSRSGRRA